MRSYRNVAAMFCLILLSPLAGCAAQSPAALSSPTTLSSPASPLTVDNCGFAVTFDSPPRRVVTIKSTPAELLIALGVGDRIVGAAFLDGPLPEGSPALPVISDRVPAQEPVLELEPDLVFAGWESTLTAEGAGDRSLLADLGVRTLVSASACKGDGYRPDPETFDRLFEEFRVVGTIFGVPDAARALVEEQRAALAAVTPSTAGLTALWYSSGSDSPYVGGGIGAPQMMLEAAGLTNVAGDVRDTWTSMGWEAVVAAEPDVIVLIDAAWNTAASKIALLESNPATAQLSAVREHRYLTIPFAAGEAGVRNVSAVASLVAQLHDLRL